MRYLFVFPEKGEVLALDSLRKEKEVMKKWPNSNPLKIDSLLEELAYVRKLLAATQEDMKEYGSNKLLEIVINRIEVIKLNWYPQRLFYFY